MRHLLFFCRGEVVKGFGRGSKELGIPTGERRRGSPARAARGCFSRRGDGDASPPAKVLFTASTGSLFLARRGGRRRAQGSPVSLSPLGRPSERRRGGWLVLRPGGGAGLGVESLSAVPEFGGRSAVLHQCPFRMACAFREQTWLAPC